MTEFEFCFCVLGEPMWVRDLKLSSVGDRPKLISAFRKLIKRAGDDLSQLGSTMIFAPPKVQTGAFFHEPGDFEHMIYLSPALDEESQRQVDYSVAHEFAHAVAHNTGSDVASTECICGRTDDCDCDDCECQGCHNFDMELTPDFGKTPEEYVNCVPEYAADELVLKWGYKLPAWKAKLRKALGSLPGNLVTVGSVISTVSSPDSIRASCISASMTRLAQQAHDSPEKATSFAAGNRA